MGPNAAVVHGRPFQPLGFVEDAVVVRLDDEALSAARSLWPSRLPVLDGGFGNIDIADFRPRAARCVVADVYFGFPTGYVRCQIVGHGGFDRSYLDVQERSVNASFLPVERWSES